MYKISIISSSIRNERQSQRVALYFKNYLEEKNLAEVEILDLLDYNFPIFNERLKFQKNPDEKTKEFAEKFKNSDGILIITPEYNGGYPASLKNIIDLLTDEWYHKPVAISTVSNGNFGGSQVITSLQFILWKLKAFITTAYFPVQNITENFDSDGNPTNKIIINKQADRFIKEFFWFLEAKSKMN